MSDAKLSTCYGKAFSILGAVFLAGAMLGAVGMRAFEHSNAHASESRARVVEVAVENLTAELSLSPDQVKKVQMILDESIMMEADHLAQIQKIQENGRGQILQLLDHEQDMPLEMIGIRLVRP